MDELKNNTRKRLKGLGHEASKRLLNEVAIQERLLENTSFERFLKDINLVCKALSIYRSLSAQVCWWGTGDETPHSEYLEQMDIVAKKMYKKHKNKKFWLED